jgi:hypothetical protein
MKKLYVFIANLYIVSYEESFGANNTYNSGGSFESQKN